MIEQIIKQLEKNFPVSLVKNGFKIDYVSKKPVLLSFDIELTRLIFPLREGELIKDINHLKEGEEYSLSYPGTASTKSMVLFTLDEGGIFVGGLPTYEWAKIKIKHKKDKKVNVSFLSPEHKLYFFPFKVNWRLGAEQYKKAVNIDMYEPIVRKPKFLLQIGVKNQFGRCYVKDFSELKKPIDYFHKHLGPGHIIHLFGTNKNGFDRMAPDYTFCTKLGGESSMEKLVKYIQGLGHEASHHYNPRIVDSLWVKENPQFKEAILKKDDNLRVAEEYKGRKHFFMNPNNELWFKESVSKIKYFHDIGFDFIELDQFTYQRNFYDSKKPLHLGYKKIIKECEKLGIKYWLEGVSDIHKLKKGCFFQILARDIPQVWEDNESRRGYPHGVSHPTFFMYLYPNTEVSFQLITEKKRLRYFKKRLDMARRINASVYDLQMTFYNKNYYMKLLRGLIEKIKEHEAENG